MTAIGVVGYGVVGQAIDLGFREKGFTVYVNERNMNVLPIINDALESIIPINNHPKSFLLDACDIIFLCVPTPTDATGHIVLTFLTNALDELYAYTYDEEHPHIVVIKSTVIPGTTDKLQQRYPRFRFVVNPEFLRPASADEDFLHPDRIIIGADDLDAAHTVLQLYDDWHCPRCITTPTTAELIKYLSNAYLVSKVAFACTMQRLCQHYHVDADLVYKGVTSDHRIHPSHLNPQLGPIAHDSPCLPKDLQAFIHALKDKDIDATFLQTVYDHAVEPPRGRRWMPPQEAPQ